MFRAKRFRCFTFVEKLLFFMRVQLGGIPSCHRLNFDLVIREPYCRVLRVSVVD